MKTRHIDGLWFAFAVIIAVLIILSGCTTSKGVHQERNREKVERNLQETIDTKSQATTKTDTRSVSDTRIFEEFDTTIRKLPSEIAGYKPLNDFLKGERIKSETGDMTLETYYDSITGTIRSQAIIKEQNITIKAKRITERHEVSAQQQSKSENSGTSLTRKDQLSKQSDTEKKDKDVTRTGFPAWLIIAIIFAVIVGVAVLLWRMKVF